MIPNSISKKILTIGESYIDYKGGISSVINTYSNYISPFKFVCTYKPTKNKVKVIFNFLAGLINIFKVLYNDKNIVIVHIHGAAKGSIFRKYIISLICRKIFKKKIIYHSHGSEFKKFYQESNKFVKKIISNLVENADLLICLSKQWKEFFSTNFEIKNIVILENIIEKPTKSIKEKDEILKVLFLGYIGDRKGVFDLLDVIRKNKNILEGKLKLSVGGNGEVERLQDYTTKYELVDLIKFEGWVSGEKKQILFSETDVYILPSYNEGLPISILEAMSYGLPIISTPVGGIAEIVQNNINGFVITPGDKKALLKSLITFIQNPDLITIMGNESSKMVIPYYAENVVPKLEQIYQSLLPSLF